MNDFLPDNYSAPQAGSNYMKFVDGKNKFRILSSAIVGWLDWDNKKPVRTKTQPDYSFDPDKPAKHFWAFVVWDYQTEKINILEVTQASIRNGILALVNDEVWGDPKGYDLIVTKEGKDLETKYTVMPVPHKPISHEIQTAYDLMQIDLNELYRNGDPFKKSSPELNTPVMQAQPETLEEVQF